MYYYNHYRNYVARTSSAVKTPMARAWPADIVGPAAGRIAPGSSVLLNKAQTGPVLDYARNLASGIVGLKDAAKMFLYDMHLINRNGTITFESHLKWVEEDLQNFISSYNNIQQITHAYAHSPELTHFAHYIRNFTEQSSQILSHLGVITYESSNLTYHGMGATASKETASQAVDTFKGAYRAARDFLEHPLAQHMGFRGLNYYYNYTIGEAGSSTFDLIGSGMLLDVAV
jgi:hypothetical protein